MLERVICLVIGYIFGVVFQTGYWYGKFNKIDIREYGSGNAGTTNVMRTLGKKAGIITYMLDMLKAVFAAIVVHFVFGKNSDYEMLLFMYSGFGVVLGHNFPFYLKFKGGKGIAASSGVSLSLFLFPNHCWVFAVFGLITFASVTLITKYVSMGSLVFISLFMLEFVVFGAKGWLPLTGNALIEAYCVLGCITLLAFIRHRGNISRLIHGNERKIGQKKSEQ